MNDYLKFQKLLAWFVNQLNINNGVTYGDKVTGRGYNDNSSLRKYYDDYRSYEGFDLDCTINHQYGNYATTSNYINLADTDFNVIPEFDNNSKAVISLYIGNHPAKKPIERKSESVSVASLGLNVAEPNQALCDFFDMFKQKILEYKNNSAQYLKTEFMEWLGTQTHSGGKPYKSITITAYSNALKNACGFLTDINLPQPDLFYQTDATEFRKLRKLIENSSLYAQVNIKFNNQAFSAGMNKYYDFLTARASGDLDTTIREQPMPKKEGTVNEYHDEEVEEDAATNKKEIETLTLNCLGGLKKKHKILERASLFELNNGKNVLIRQSKLLSTGYFYGLQKAIVDSDERIDYLILVKGDEGFYKLPYALIKGLCLDGSISFAEKGKSANEAVKGYRIFLTMDNDKYMLKLTGSKQPMNIDNFLTKFKYAKEDFLSEVYFEPTNYDDMVALLTRKKNIILQGAPGVGKSYMAKRLAYSIIGLKDESKVEMIQFHQNYSYEDFIEGFRPNANGSFELKQGVFYEFCAKAQKDNPGKYFFIIDEINRGNLSKVMGELMLLLEHDKRGEEFAMKLTYSNKLFYVPENVYVIGMMNTADRSLAMIDYALRRRFSFIPINPMFDNSKFIADFRKNYLDTDTVIEKIQKLNAFISEKLDSGHQIGHSYFCSNSPLTPKDIEGIFKYEIEELLNEYFFDDKDNLEKAKGLLR